LSDYMPGMSLSFHNIMSCILFWLAGGGMDRYTSERNRAAIYDVETHSPQPCI